MARTPEPAAADAPELSIYEWPAGEPLPPNARDASDELLPEGGQISDEERAEREQSIFEPDWSVTARVRD